MTCLTSGIESLTSIVKFLCLPRSSHSLYLPWMNVLRTLSEIPIRHKSQLVSYACGRLLNLTLTHRVFFRVSIQSSDGHDLLSSLPRLWCCRLRSLLYIWPLSVDPSSSVKWHPFANRSGISLFGSFGGGRFFLIRKQKLMRSFFSDR